MQTPIVVDEIAPEYVAMALNHLQDAGIDGEALDDPNPAVEYASFGTYRVRIAVPSEDAARARQILKRWERGLRRAGRALETPRVSFPLVGVPLLLMAVVFVADTLTSGEIRPELMMLFPIFVTVAACTLWLRREVQRPRD